jgi:hypothetical protein
MQHHEAIIIDALDSSLFETLANKAFRYALISVPFTFNRMEKSKILPRIENIFKGKLAEEIFLTYCNSNFIKVDFDACTTPFWMPDQRDFLWLGGEWDLKNNFFYCSDAEFSKFDLTSLPALIPNNYDHDQWSKRNDTLLGQSKFMAYVFSFMRLNPDNKAFFKTLLNQNQIDFIQKVIEQYRTIPISKMASFETWFFKELTHLGTTKLLETCYQPEMIITACANARHYHLFQNTSANDDHYQFLEHSVWYEKMDKVVRFLDGKVVTTIRNKTCPVGFLPSFMSVVNLHTRQSIKTN